MKFYRYELVEYAVTGHDGEYTSPTIPNPKLELRELNMFKETAKGYWIGYGNINALHSPGKWVSKTSRKRYAYPTKKEALEGFVMRTQKRAKILKWELCVCNIGLMLAENEKTP